MNKDRPVAAPKPPKKWKMAIVVWSAIYPLITLVQWLFGPQLAKVAPLALRTLILTAILVPLMVYVVLPVLQKALSGWLRR